MDRLIQALNKRLNKNNTEKLPSQDADSLYDASVKKFNTNSTEQTVSPKQRQHEEAQGLIRRMINTKNDEMGIPDIEETRLDPNSRRIMERRPIKISSEPRYAKGGKINSASRRADGIAQRGKTKGRII